MSDEAPYLMPILGWASAAVALGIAAWFLAKARRPCPHCGRKAERAIRTVHSVAGGARDLLYECRACGGAMRYARRPDGEEFWEPIEEPAGRPS